MKLNNELIWWKCVHILLKKQLESLGAIHLIDIPSTLLQQYPVNCRQSSSIRLGKYAHYKSTCYYMCKWAVLWLALLNLSNINSPLNVCYQNISTLFNGLGFIGGIKNLDIMMWLHILVIIRDQNRSGIEYWSDIRSRDEIYDQTLGLLCARCNLNDKFIRDRLFAPNQ